MSDNRKSMASKASKTLRNKRASKISKSLVGNVLAKSRYKRNEQTKSTPSVDKSNKNKGKSVRK